MCFPMLMTRPTRMIPTTRPSSSMVRPSSDEPDLLPRRRLFGLFGSNHISPLPRPTPAARCVASHGPFERQLLISLLVSTSATRSRPSLRVGRFCLDSTARCIRDRNCSDQPIRHPLTYHPVSLFLPLRLSRHLYNTQSTDTIWKLWHVCHWPRFQQQCRSPRSHLFRCCLSLTERKTLYYYCVQCTYTPLSYSTA